MLSKRFALICLFLLFAACASQPAASNGAPSGTWSGDYEAGSGRRESVSVDLRWEDANLRGAVHASGRSLPLTKASFSKDTGAIVMEFDAEGNGGRTVHYLIDGKIDGNSMSGKWTHDDQRGDFSLTKR